MPLEDTDSFVDQLKQVLDYVESKDFQKTGNKLTHALYITGAVGDLVSRACFNLLDGIDSEEEDNLEEILDIATEELLQPLIDKMPRFQRWGVETVISSFMGAAPSVIADRWNLLVEVQDPQ